MKQIKTSAQILAQMLGYSHYKPLRNMFFAREFIELLNPAQQALIATAYIKKDCLMIIVKHQVAYQELNHDDTKKWLKTLIKIYAKEQPLSEFNRIKELKIVLDRHFYKPTPPQKKRKFYLEISKGEFKNILSNPNLHEKFEQIREKIKKNNELCEDLEDVD